MDGADQMRQYTERYDALKVELQSLGFLFQSSLQTRRIVCGKTTCRCYHDPDARHGPYHYWTRKAGGKTVGRRLTEDELLLYQGVDREQPRTGTDREGNARPRFARAGPHNLPGGAMNPRVSGSSAAVTATTATAILQTLRPAD